MLFQQNIALNIAVTGHSNDHWQQKYPAGNFISESDTSRTVSHMVKQGTARKIGPRLYTRNMSEPVDIIVARNRWQIVGMLAPGGVIGYPQLPMVASP